ncbi:MAG: DNRLRE domain-containing protein [Deltaproteobacteria bacterium]|nr:DNRLRE domain-containing protein [Deltaproteobacteria bacterium]
MRSDLAWVLAVVATGCVADIELEVGTTESESVVPLRPDADAHVRSGKYARTNYGTSTSLPADQSDSSTIKQSYLRFAVPAGAITKAMLRLYVTSSSANAVDIHSITTATWSESALTWDTRPALDGTRIGSFARVSSSAWVELDVTAAVTPGQPLSLALIPRSTDGVAFASRERSSGKPELVLTLVDVVPPPPPPVEPPPAVADGSRGYLTTPGELAIVRSKALQGTQPYRAAADRLATYVQAPTYWPYAGFALSFDRDVFDGASTLIYAKALAYHVHANEAFAASARDRLLELANSGVSSGGDDLGLVRHIPGFIAAADLLATYPGWTAADKRRFQDWLRGPGVYKIVDEVSHEKANNWGFMGSGAAAYVADYLAGSGLTLHDRADRQVTAAQAWAESNLKGTQRMNDGDGSMSCSSCPGMTGIWPSGRIPHETGRGATGCYGEYLVTDDESLGYMVSAANGLVRHAELRLRRGDRSMYDNVTSTGRGSLLRAIRYVIDNPAGSWPWNDGQIEILEPAYRYYRNDAIGAELGIGATRVIASSGSSATSGPNGFLDFTTLTHGFAPGENPGLPPTVPPPQ